MSRRWVMVLAVLALVTVACKAGSDGTVPVGRSQPVPVPGLPASMAALGDSITAGFGSCLAPSACPRHSWSTGDGSQVTSHYRRIVKANPALAGHGRNLAV